MYLMKNRKNTPESPEFGNGHIHLVRMEQSTGQILVEVWFVWVILPLESSGENIFFFIKIFCQNKAEKENLPLKF